MVYIVTALQIEASPVIEYFKLKRDLSINEYQIYRNSEIALIVGGVGKIKSAMAAVYLLTSCKASKKDILLNIGFCGASTAEYPLGSLLLINKISDMDTGRDYYPDIFSGRNLPKAALYCCSKPMEENILKEKAGFFCDMESSGIMEAAKKFTYTHKVVILKVISDYLTPLGLDKEQLKGYIRNQIPFVEEIINALKLLDDSLNEIKMEQESMLLGIISENLKFSRSMNQILFSEVKRMKLRGYDPLKILEAYRLTSINSKVEGKRIFEQIIGELKKRCV